MGIGSSLGQEYLEEALGPEATHCQPPLDSSTFTQAEC